MHTPVTLTAEEVQDVVHALRFASAHKPHLTRLQRWKYARKANSIERRAR